MQQGPDLAYNQSVPASWWTTTWRPNQWCYGQSTYGGGWGSGTDSTACMANNVYCTTQYFKAMGWSFQSIMAMCGNIQSESGFDPRNWEVNADPTRGFGLIQWTPASQYFNDARGIWGSSDGWAPYFYSGWYESYVIAYEVWEIPRRQWVKHRAGQGGNPAPGSGGTYPGNPPDYDYRLSYEEFAQGVIYDTTVPNVLQDKLDYLTGAFYWDYEQVGDYVADYTLPQRRTRTMNWYNRFVNIFGDFPAKAQLVNPPYKPNEDTTLQDIIRLNNGIDPKLIAAILSGRNQHRCKIILI